jgi:stage III sporulation protein SpoIIIAA
MININNEPVTYGALKQWLETLLDKPADTSSKNGLITEASGVNNRFDGAELALPLTSEPSAKVESAYKSDEKLLGEEVARAVQFLPKNIIQELERKVREKNINPQTIEEFQIDLDRHVRVDTGASSKEAAKNGLGISPLTLLGAPNKEADNALKIKQADLNKIKSSIMFNLGSGRGGLKDVEDLSRFSISERNGLPVNITIRVGKAVEAPLPLEIQKIVLDAVQNKKKVLFLGQTGVGKTTLIRQISKFLSDKGVSPSIFDKSEEIAGHGLTPHSALGHLARRFVIQPLKNVAQSLISMIENHNPKALIIDELSDREQFSGVRRMIDEKGIPTAFIFTHGTTLGKAMHSENIRELLAKVDTVIVGDETAQKTGNGDVQDKIRHNVIGHSMVDVVVEMPVRGVFVVHENTLDSMKKLAAGEEPTVKVYPKGTNIRNYRSEEAEQFIEPKNKLSLPMRPATRPSGVSSTDLSKHEDELEEERHPRTGGKQAKSPPPPPSTSHAKYPLLVKNYKKGEIDSMPLHKLTKLQQQLLDKQKGEGNLPRVQKQLLDWVNAAKERQTESGGETVREFNKKYGFNPTPNQKQALDSLDNQFDKIKEERKEREANRSSNGQSN